MNIYKDYPQNECMYFNYHAKAKRLIREGHLIGWRFVEKHNKISPALVLYFDNEKPMPIRMHRFEEYIEILNKL